MAKNSRKSRFLHRRNGRTDGRTDRRTDRPTYRDARTHLKMGKVKMAERIGVEQSYVSLGEVVEIGSEDGS